MTCGCGYELARGVEQGGLLLRGNAPILRVTGGTAVIEQRCPRCKALHDLPLRVTGSTRKEPAIRVRAAGRPARTEPGKE